MKNTSDIVRWNSLPAIEHETLYFPSTEWIRAADHDRIVADLKECLSSKDFAAKTAIEAGADLLTLIAKAKAEIEHLRTVLEAVRSQMCWERDRDQLTMGMASIHDAVTEALK